MSNNPFMAVDADKLKKELQEHRDFLVNAYGGFSNLPLKEKARVDEITQCIARVVNLRHVEAVEVTHGRWEYHECVSSYDGAISGYSCSECRGFVNEEIFDMDEFHKDFCGHCSAKMDGGNEDD